MIRRPGLALLALCLFALHPLHAQTQISWTDQEKPIFNQIRGLRGLPDDQRAVQTKDLALQIRQLPAGDHKLKLAEGLSHLATEGDFGRDTLQEVTTTLAQAVQEHPITGGDPEPASPYRELAELALYEHMKVPLQAPQFVAATANLKQADQMRQQADFTLKDLQGKLWILKQLRGKVVLVNFWATWCPPCRKEMPDLDALYRRFKDQNFVILAISDEEESTVKAFLTQHGVSYPVLLDPGDKARKLFDFEGIPKTFVYDRDGKLVSESIDMRTRKQFLEMLSEAGLK